MEVPDQSKKYLEEFLSFARKILPYEPVILGGWAVYAYTKKQKSVDVDVLFKTKKDIALLKPFFTERKFKQEEDRQGNVTFELETTKHEYKGITLESIIFDLMLVDEPNVLHSNKNISVPWELCYEFNEKAKLNGTEILAPTKELLVILKTKALLDREYDKYKLKNFTNKQWLKRKDFKIEKDKQDIKDLFETTINQTKLETILEKTNFKTQFQETIKTVIK
ncbi:MAG: hypothetical protein WCW13_04760 [archaeon]